jgi:hypothetical protein
MKVTLRHQCRLLQTGRWTAGFSLKFIDGPTLIDQQCFEPRTELTFEFEEQARERNRLLAWNWKQAEAPEIELYERRA